MTAGGDGGVIDALTSIDEKLDALISVTSQQGQSRQERTQSDTQQDAPRANLRGRRDTVELSASVPKGVDRLENSFVMPYDGCIESIIIDMPDGADNLVGASLREAEEDRILFPEGGDPFVAFNDFGDRFSFRREAEKNKEFLAVFTSQKNVDVPINFLVEVKEIV